MPSRLIAPLLLVSLLFGGTRAEAVVDPNGGFGDGPIAGTLNVQVIDGLTGAPIEGAFCQVGEAPGTPFAGNLGFTNAGGNVSFTDAALTGAQTVSVGKTGYNYFTVYDIDASTMIIPIIQYDDEVQKSVYDGVVNGIGFTNNDGNFDLAIVLPTIGIGDITSLANFGTFSPIVLDTFPLIGETGIPGILYLPFQVEFLFIGVDRTPYFINLETNTTQDLFAFNGRVPTSVLLDGLGGAELDFLALAQDFTLREYGIVEGLNVTGDASGVDITLTADDVRDTYIDVQNTLPGFDVFAIEVGDLDGLTGLGRLVMAGFAGFEGGTDDIVEVTTIEPIGPFAGMDYFAGAVQNDTIEGRANTFASDRTSRAPGDTASVTDFFLPPQPDLLGPAFSWNSVENPGISGPADIYQSTITLVTTVPDTTPGADPQIDTLDLATTLWEFVMIGSDTDFTIPNLGPNVLPGLIDPAVTPDQDRLTFNIFGLGLGINPSFDFNEFDLVDRALDATQIAWNSATFLSFPSELWTSVPGGRDRDAIRVLSGARPNPFRGETVLLLNLGAKEGRFDLEVFNIAGRRVRTLLSGASGSGEMTVTWDGMDASGRRVPAGSYFLRLSDGERVYSTKVVKTR